jgi:hypothetical protein
MIHSKVVTKEVNAIILVLSRSLNNEEDTKLRDKYKAI